MKRIRKIIWLLLLCAVLLSCAICAVSCQCENEQPDEYTILSAYNKARELGFNGTLEDFIVSIKGIDGKDGQDGSNGVDGTDGKNGIDGKDGTNGKDGIDGVDGVGIKSVELNSDGELVITDTDGNVIFRHKLPLCSHDYSESVVGLAPTCVSAGYNYKTCSKCNDAQYQVTPALGHSWDDGVEVYKSDCVRNGLILYSCENCDLTKSEIVAPTGVHKYQNGACIYCNNTRNQILDDYYNVSYGYDYLSTMTNGDKLTALYDAIHAKVLYFHNSAEADAEAVDGNYVLLKVNPAQYGLTIEQAVSVWKTYMDDKPLYYWLSKYTMVADDETIAIFVDEEYAQGDVRSQYNERLYKLIDAYKDVAEGESAYSVAFAYHDKIIDAIDYAYKDNRVPENALWAHNIVGVFEGKGAVCEGYARAFQLLLNTRNIQNVLVTGQSYNQNHGWNLVRLDDGNWYWYDLTWDDQPNKYWGVSHDNLCATDDEFLQNHQFDLPTDSDVSFLYGLPSRANDAYAGNEIKYLDEFVEDGATCVVVGYDIIAISNLVAEGEYAIPETVTYRGREFTVIALTSFRDGEVSEGSILYQIRSDVESVTIPSTVAYICDRALYSNYLQSIVVDENNPKFCSLDGVLFTKNLLTLITYPGASPRVEYVIPDETYYIASGAFNSGRGSGLEKLTLGKSVHTVGVANWGNGYPEVVGDVHNILGDEWNRILTNCFPNIIQLSVHPDNTRYKIKSGMLLNCDETILYAGLPDVETVVIPQTVMEIKSRAFHNIKSLKNVTFISAPIYIGSSLFSHCSNLEQVTLPEGMKTIPESMFVACSSLKTITIPSTVTSVGHNAFMWCEKVDTIVIPDQVESMGRWTFSGCFSLTTLVISKSVKSIDKDILGQIPSECLDASKLEIYFTGAEAEWDDISKENTFTESQLNELHLYFYSDEQPNEQGNYWHYVDGEITKW